MASDRDPRDRRAAWRGAELMACLNERGDGAGAEPSWDELASALDEGAASAPLARLVTRIRTDLEEGPGVVRLPALPVERWGADASARVFRTLMERIGTPLSQSADGKLVFRVRDEGFAPDDPRFRGPSSSRSLRFHSDRCDVIAFLCLRPARTGGETSVVSSVALHDVLAARRPDLLAVLREPYPFLRHTVDPANPLPYCMLPIFSEHEGRFACHLLRVLIDRADESPDAPSLTPAQREALDELERRTEDPALVARFRLGPGDVLLLNNWVTLHRRDAFEDDPDPARRRELLRIWLAVPNSRPLVPAFRDHFGATGAGEMRGGMRPFARDER